MDDNQELEWEEAQKIFFTGQEDLVAAARRQLLFLRAIDGRRALYVDGPVLRRAVYRYKTCWLPLLDKYSKSNSIIDGPLVVPLDCEWIWHCHRLNPLQYKKDCENLYGRILDSQDVRSKTLVKLTSPMLELWDRLYPEEPFELDYINEISSEIPVAAKNFDYDLVAAVIRQSSFCYQVSRPVMHDDRFLKAALARYKGFLHLIKRSQENSLKRFSVPTYDIDIMWHSHQLQSVAYCNDTVRIIGKVLGHDDTDSDRSNGSKLDIGFSETTRQWEASYGLRYWRAGAMYRGNVPSPVTLTPLYTDTDITAVSPDYCCNYINLSCMKIVEVLLQVVSVKNAPSHKKGSLYVSFGKKRPDMFLGGCYRLNIQSETGMKNRACFRCEPADNLILNLMLTSTLSWSAKTIGTTSISLKDLTNHDSELAIDKWIELNPKSKYVGSKPIYLHIAASFTVPVTAPHVLHMVRSFPFFMNTCFSPFPRSFQKLRAWWHFIDDNNNKFISLQMRSLKKKVAHRKFISKQVLSLRRGSSVPHVLAELTGNVWSLVDSKFFLSLENKFSQDGHIFEFIGEPMMKLYNGRRLDFAPKNCKCCKNRENEHNYITVVGFSADDPYGKAIALINLKSGVLKVNEDWFVLPGILMAFILSDMLKSQGYNAFVPCSENRRESVEPDQDPPLQKLTSPMKINPDLMEKISAKTTDDDEPGNDWKGKSGSGCGGGGCSGNKMGKSGNDPTSKSGGETSLAADIVEAADVAKV